MSLFKGKLDSGNKFTASDDVTGLEILFGYDGSGNKVPAYIQLESPDGGDNFLFFDDDANLKLSTSAPTSSYDSEGGTIAGASNTGANLQLSNLGTTAVNADIIVGDDINLALGASSDVTMDWRVGGGCYIDFAAADSTVHFGDTNPSSLVFHGANGGYDAAWDGAADCFQIIANAKLRIGDSAALTQDDGVTIYHDGSNLDIDSVAANEGIIFGSSTNTDVTFESQSSASKDIHWDASAYTLRFLDTTILGFGTGDISDYDLGFSCSSTPLLSLLQKSAGVGAFAFGVNDVGIDVTWFSDVASAYIKWDASEDLLLFEDTGISVLGAGTDYQLAISTDALLLDEVNDHANGNLILGANGTNGLDVTFEGATSGDHVKFVATGTWTYTDVPVTMTGVDSSGTLLTITGVDTAGNSTTVLIDHSGDGYAIDIDLNEATSDGIRISPHTDATVPALEVDGDGAGFLGAADVGMVLLRNDIALADVASSILLIENGATAPINSGEGYAFRIKDTSTVAGAEAWAGYIDATANSGLGIETRATTAHNLTLLGVQSQAASMLLADGTTGTGWVGADDTGMVHIKSKVAGAHIGATNLYVGNATGSVKASAQGALARFENTAAAQAGANMVEITAKDNTEYALKVGAGMALFSDWVHATGFHYTPTDITATDAGLQLTAIDGFYNVDTTTADDGDIVLLPAGLQGMIIYMYNKDAAQEFVVTPNGTETLNGGGAGAGMNLAEDELCQLICTTDGVWVGNLIGTDGTYTKMT